MQLTVYKTPSEFRDAAALPDASVYAVRESGLFFPVMARVHVFGHYVYACAAVGQYVPTLWCWSPRDTVHLPAHPEAPHITDPFCALAVAP
jgi:hypothetical protein